MKYRIISLFLIAMVVSHAYEQQPCDELKRIETLSTALQNGGVTGLLSTAASNGWACPRMPSKWHVENRCHSNDWRKVLYEARNLGLAIAVELDREASDFQTLQPDEELGKRTDGLCDLSEWCAATTGIGNILLAQRSLDIAAVGLTRLTANLDYPLESCEKLAARMTPGWMSVASRAAVFNDEAGAKLFSGSEPPEELERMLGTGRFWLKLSQGWKNPVGWKTDLSCYAEKKIFFENLDFFSFDENDRSVPHTVVMQWDRRRYLRIANGLELQTIMKALALVEFRRIVGAFPEKVVWTPEELLKRDEEIAFYAKQGVKIIKEEDTPYYNPMREAFRQAWLKMQPHLPIARYNDYGNAFQAYDEIKRCCFRDQDTISAKLFEDQVKRREAIREKREASEVSGDLHSGTNALANP